MTDTVIRTPAPPQTDAEIRIFPAGTPIFREGHPADAGYLINQGLVEISARRNGVNRTIAMLGPGSLFGELALIDDGLRVATATAREATEVVVIPRELVQQKLEAADPLIARLLSTLLYRFRATHHERLSLLAQADDGKDAQ